MTELPGITEKHGLYRTIRAMLVMAIACGLLTGYAVHRWRETNRYPLSAFPMDDTWIEGPRAGSYAGYFRKRLELSGTVVHAWIVIAACESFEVTVNGNPVARQYLWRPTRPFQNGLSEKGQRLTATESAVGLNFPREYQWSGHETHRVPIYIDIRPELRPGRNVIGIQVESRQAPAKFWLEGRIATANGESIAIRSDPTWKAEPVPPGRQSLDWTESSYHDQSWRQAVASKTPSAPYWCAVSPAIFTDSFQGANLRNPAASADAPVWFRGRWQLPAPPKAAWLRLATDRTYALFINGVRVCAAGPFAPDMDGGQWIMERQRGLDPQERPAILDPDELDSPFVGDAFEDPPAGDPTTNDFRWLPLSVEDVRARSANISRTFIEKHAAVRDRVLAPQGHVDSLRYPDAVRPQSHSQDRSQACFAAYDVARLLHRGINDVEVRLSESDGNASYRHPPTVALDGNAQTPVGSAPLRSDSSWQTRSPTASWQDAVAIPMNPSIASALPRLQYRGTADHINATVARCAQWQWITVAAMVLISLLAVGFIHRTHRDPLAFSRWLASGFLAAGAVLAAGVALQVSFAERYESLWFRHPTTWQTLLLAGAIAAGIVSLWDSRVPAGAWHRWPTTRAWRVLLLAILLLAFLLRAYRMDFQPLDDDEYASAQAIAAIAETGIPQFASDDVWYTRSPLFHYTLGFCAALFGTHLGTLRLPCALFGVATCGLAYLFGSRLLKNSWIGLGAMLLLAVHPYEVYTGHVIRFYQLQQLLALITLYWFCKGFVTDQSPRYRYLTILAFVATVLCQESSCVMGFSLLLGYLLFAEDLGRSHSVKLATAGACALAVIALDYAIFQTRCMTRLAGISPNLEATVTPHFWQPYNLLALLVGYSRLHLIGSVFLLLGLPQACRQRRRCTLALYVIFFSGVVMTNLWVTHVSLRYQYWLIPIWVILSLEGMYAVVQRAVAMVEPSGARRARHIAVITAIGLATCLLVLSPWRIVSSYNTKLLGDSTGALQFIRAHKRPEDRVMVTGPHTHAALMETGRVDYDLSIPLHYDYAVMQDGVLIDRNGGAEVIGDLPHLAAALQSNDRLWIAVNHEKLRSRGKNLRWEYPGARIDLFLRRNCELVHKTYLWSVYLWDVRQGSFVSFRIDQL